MYTFPDLGLASGGGFHGPGLKISGLKHGFPVVVLTVFLKCPHVYYRRVFWPIPVSHMCCDSANIDT